MWIIYEGLSEICSRSKKGVSQRSIALTEEKLGFKLNTDLVDLYKLVNACEIGDWILFPIKDERNIRKTWDDLIRNNQNSLKPEGFPDNFVIIGENGTGNFICYKVENKQMTESIFYWDHEKRNIEGIANNLKQFIVENEN